jgi:RNA recognition motif-containing protein
MRLYVGGLPYSTNENDLASLFEQVGAVVNATVITDRDTGRSKGFGFVEMGSSEEGQAAIAQLNGTQLGERTITVSEARARDAAPRSGGRGGYGGGGGGGNRGGRY